MKIVYEAFDEGTDGMNRTSIGLFLDKQSAVRAAKGRGAMGCGDGGISERELFDSYNDFISNNRSAKLAAALAKLTDEDRKLLGLG